MSVIGQIRCHLQELGDGEPFVVSSLLPYGSRAAVDQALSRLVREGTIERISRGVYARPKVSRLAGRVLPTPEQVAHVVSAARGAAVQIHGAEAARRLQLTTQAPLQPKFWTTGPSRRLRLGATEVELKHTSARKLALAGRPAGEALAALWYIGREGVTSEAIERIRLQLPEAEFQALVDARPLMPAWMAEAVSDAVKGGSDGRGSVPSPS